MGITRPPPTGALASFICFIAAYSPSVVANGNGHLVNDTACDCYLTNGSNSAYYTEHRFYDFRNLSPYAGVPSLITDEYDAASAGNTSDYFASANWNSAWTPQSSNNSAQVKAKSSLVLRVYSPNNVYIEKNDDTSSATYLTLRTARETNFQSAAEITTVSSTYQFVSVRFKARTHGSSGAVTALFTYLETGSKLSDIQEADLEIRTMDPENTIQYTNQPSQTDAGDDVPEATRNSSMPGGLHWTDWAVYRFDWTPTQSMWYVNGEEVANISFQVPRDPAPLIFNAWSNGGPFTGNMTVGGEAFMNIEWINMVFNNTGEVAPWTDSPTVAGAASQRKLAKKADGCKTVCSIDNTAELGAAELAEGSSTGTGRGALSGGIFSLVVPVFASAILTFTS